MYDDQNRMLFGNIMNPLERISLEQSLERNLSTIYEHLEHVPQKTTKERIQAILTEFLNSSQSAENKKTLFTKFEEFLPEELDSPPDADHPISRIITLLMTIYPTYRREVAASRLTPIARYILNQDEVTRAFSLPAGLDLYREKKGTPGAPTWLCRYSMFAADDPDRSLALSKALGETPFANVHEDRAMGCLFGLLIGDALGAPREFSPVNYDNKKITGFNDWAEWEVSSRDHNRFKLKPGQWTDDSAMALCLADSLIAHQEFKPKDLRLRFLNWVAYGYNNTFGNDPDNPHGRPSIGLGGTIQLSLAEFMATNGQSDYTQCGDEVSSGNGSIMRLAPVPIRYCRDLETGMQVAYNQSKTTHQGEEAAECCRLLTHLMGNAIIREAVLREESTTTQALLDDLLAGFTSTLSSVNALAKSAQEHIKRFGIFKIKSKNRNWNWKDFNFKFSPSRSDQSPGYVGSYCMDCLAMALHCVYTTNSFPEAVVKAASLGGDSDTVAAVTGQIAGAIYGSSAIPNGWIQAVLQWDGHKDIPLRAYKLYHH